eukprot:scaffold256016_cov28-Tisochrysis_lutea.AAC.3
MHTPLRSLLQLWHFRPLASLACRQRLHFSTFTHLGRNPGQRALMQLSCVPLNIHSMQCTLNWAHKGERGLISSTNNPPFLFLFASSQAAGRGGRLHKGKDAEPSFP